MANTRFSELQALLTEYRITWRALGKEVGMSDCGIRNALMRDTCRPELHDKLIHLGLPEDMLPSAMPIRRTRALAAPDFEGLRRATLARGTRA